MRGASRAAAGLLLAMSGGEAAAGVTNVRYLCERGVEVPATYVHDGGETSVAVLTVEGSQVTLIGEPAASGARYGWPSSGSGYVWWTKDNATTLLWRDGETTIEEPVYSDCRRID